MGSGKKLALVRLVIRSSLWCGLGLAFSLVCMKTASIYAGWDIDGFSPSKTERQEAATLHLETALGISYAIPWLFAVLIFKLALRRHLPWACVCYVCGVLISYPMQIFAWAVPIDLRYYEQTRFDPIEWRLVMPVRHVDVGLPSRRKMADDLVSNSLLCGRSRSEVLQLLGPGLTTPPDGLSTGALCYFIGPDRSFLGRFSTEYLLVTFDSGLVVDSVDLILR